MGDVPPKGSGTAPMGAAADTVRSDPPGDAKERAPRTVGRFEIHSLLGKGGMARVYRAFDPTLDRLVALKVLHAPVSLDAEAGAQQRKRSLREARAAAALTHPNTVTIYEVGEADGQPFIAMELLSGTTLRTAVPGDKPLATRLRWLLEAARALHAAHERGLVHRDVKPDNMIVEDSGRLKLLDFGIAKRDYGDAEAALAAIGITPPEGPSSLRTAEGRRLGTPRYMAPEQWSGDSTDARTDQYAWGLVAIELLTGAVPERDSDPAGQLREHDVPETVAAVVLRAVAPKMDDRAPSMLAIIDALEQVLANPAALATREETKERPLGAPPAPATTVDDAAPRRVPRWPFVLFALGVLAGGGYGARALLGGTATGQPNLCKVASSSTNVAFAPSGLVLLDGAMIGTYDASRTDIPGEGVQLVGGGPRDRFQLPFPSPDRTAMIHGTTWDGLPAVVTAVNRTGDDDPDTLVSTWVAGGRGFVMGHRLQAITTGAAPVTFRNGLLVAITLRPTVPGAKGNEARFLTLRMGHAVEVSRAYESADRLDAPAVAVLAKQVALVVRQQERKIYAVSFDDTLERMGDARLVAEGEVGEPAATFVGDTLVVVWPERTSGTTRLHVARLLAGAAAFEKGGTVTDDAVSMAAPALAPLATGGSLLAWIATTPAGSVIRATRLEPRPSAVLDVGKASRARALTARATTDGALLGWVDQEPEGTTVANVACAVRPTH